ncbi:MAG: hypothetical protein GY856_39435 [bacterium]|nr:hypothetical protein [bacterium]
MKEKETTTATKDHFIGEKGQRWRIDKVKGDIDVIKGQRFELLPDPDPAHPSAPNALIFRPVKPLGDAHWGKMKSVHFDPATGTVKGWFSNLQIPDKRNLTVKIAKIGEPDPKKHIWCEVEDANPAEEPESRQRPGAFGAEEDGRVE